MHTYLCLCVEVCLSSRTLRLGSFVWKVLFGGGFCQNLLLSECIRYNRKLNITLNFRCHMYEIFLKSVTSYARGPISLCHKLSHLLGPPPLERDVLYGRTFNGRLAATRERPEVG